MKKLNTDGWTEIMLFLLVAIAVIANLVKIEQENSEIEVLSKQVEALTYDLQETRDELDKLVSDANEAASEPEVNLYECELLACVIYQEAGGDAFTDDCRRMVADVVLNRVDDDRFPDTIYEVLTAPRQYGLFYYTGVVWPDRAHKAVETEAVNRAYRIAYEVLSGKHSDLYGNGYIWQAEFKQGIDVIEVCNTYFGR